MRAVTVCCASAAERCSLLMKRHQGRFISDATRERRWCGVARMMRRGCQCRRDRVVVFGERWRERDVETEGALAAPKLPRHSFNPTKVWVFEMRINARVFLFQPPVSRSSFAAERHRRNMLQAKRTVATAFPHGVPHTLAQLKKSVICAGIALPVSYQRWAVKAGVSTGGGGWRTRTRYVASKLNC